MKLLPVSGSRKENAPLRSSQVTRTQKPSDVPSISSAVPSTRPLRSILKNRTKNFILMPSPTASEAQPADNDPINSTMYFKSPLETLLDSIEDPGLERISLHDLIEAYNTFSNRIRSQIQVITQADRPLFALKPLKENASRLIQLLRRDIRRALVDPSSDPRRSPTLESSLISNNQMTEDEIKYARDLSSVCHHALRFLSDVVSFSALYSIFPTSDLSFLVADLLTIPLAASLPTPNARKTHTLVIWILQVQQLPLAALISKEHEITSALKRAIEGDFGKFQPISDGLEAIHVLLKRHPKQFLPPFLSLLPSILPHLTSNLLDIRLQAAHAINGFVLAKLSTPSSPDHIINSISSHLRSFIETQPSKREAIRSEGSLASIITAALSVDSPSHPGGGPIWALVVLASLIVLSDSLLFSHPRSLRLFFPSLAQALVHKRSAVRALHPYVWKCLIWAFSRISVGGGGLQVKSSGTIMVDDMKNRAFLVVKQELRRGIGIALTASLLGPGEVDPGVEHGFDRVSNALTVVQDMVRDDNRSTSQDGLSLLTRLLSAIGTSYSLTCGEGDVWDQKQVLAQGIFDGTVLNTKWENVSKVVGLMGQLNIDRVRPLSEPEIARHWDALISVWVHAIQKSLQDSTFPLLDDLLRTWQSLLLVQAQLTQGHGHLTAASAFANRIASLVSGFLVPSQVPETQFKQLTLIRKLWAVMKNVFTTSWLCVPAETILASVLKQNFLLSDEGLKDTWSKLCADLVSAGIPTFLDILRVQNERQGELELKRGLWVVLAKTLQESDDGSTWQEIASFLIIPLGVWPMSDYEVELWDGVLRNVVASAGSAGIRPTAVIEHILQYLVDDKVMRLSSLPKHILIIMSHVDLSDRDTLPTRIFSVVDQVLHDLYPPPMDLLPTALQFLRLLDDIINTASSSLIVPILATIRRGLCCWIEDEAEILLADQYNDVIIPLYRNSLNVLRHLTPSLDMLNSLSTFFASAFVHIPPPALGPMAFEIFWRATYHGLDQFCKSYPESIKVCLKAFDDAYGGDLAVGLSADTESEITPSFIVPDSQPSRGGQANSREYDTDQLHYPYLEDTIDVNDTRRNESRKYSSSLTPVLDRDPSLSRPISGRLLTPPSPATPPRPLGALQQLQDYSSYVESDSFHSRRSTGDSTTRRNPNNSLSLPEPAVPFQGTSEVVLSSLSLKRSAEVTGGQNSKRRRIAPEIRPQAAKTALQIGAFRTVGVKSSSEPVDRVVSPALPVHANSQPVGPPKKYVFDCVELPTYQEILRRERRQQSQDKSTAVGRPSQLFRHRTPPRHLQSPVASSVDFESWEAGLSTQDMPLIQREMGCDASDTSTAPESVSEVLNSLNSPLRQGTEPLMNEPDILRSPSLGTGIRHGDRPQTAPLIRPVQATPLRRSKTTSTRLDALQRAYTAVTDDASQIPVQDLVHATRLVHQIGNALNEQMSRKLADAG